MVQLTEVEDEYFTQPQAGPENDDDFTDTDSEISDESDWEPVDESFTERLYALKDLVSPTTRGWVAHKYEATTSFVKNTLSFCGRAAWAISVTGLIVVVPFAVAYTGEQEIIAMEQEARMREMGNELLTSPVAGEGEDTAGRVGAALGGGSASAQAAL